LDAHNWVRSKIVKRNPSGSVNYTLTTPDGAPVTLSDLTSLNTHYDEVIIVQDQSEHIATNPKSRDTNLTSSYEPGEYNPFEDKKGRTGSQRLKSAYPIPVPDYGYPSYHRPTRTGNNITKLLPIDISSDMIERLIAQQGTFQALHTLNKLSYDFDLADKPAGFTDPNMAALLQRYANALTKDNYVRLNPGKPYTSNTLRKHRGLVTPREAVKEFVEERYGIEGLDPEDADTLYNKAQMNKEYDMDGTIMEDFVINALVPYLAVAPANRAMLQALSKNKSALNEALVKDDWLKKTTKQITRQVTETWRDYLGRQGSSAKGMAQRLLSGGDDPIYSNIVYQKLLDLTPLTAEDFYHGMDFAIAAHPLFMTPSGQVSGVNKQFIRTLFNIAAQAPMSLQTARTAKDLKYRMSIPGRLIEGISSALGYEGWSLDEYQLNKLEILNNDALLRSEGPINVLTSFMNRVEEADSKAMSRLKPGEKFTIVEDGFGCQPTVPPFWPAKIVYAVMDVIGDNIDEIRSNRTEIDRAIDVLKGTSRSSDLMTYPMANHAKTFTLKDGAISLRKDEAYYFLKPGGGSGEFTATYQVINALANTMQAIVTDNDSIEKLLNSDNDAKGMLLPGNQQINENTTFQTGPTFNHTDLLNRLSSRESLTFKGVRPSKPKLKMIGLMLRRLLGMDFTGSEFAEFKNRDYWKASKWKFDSDAERKSVIEKLETITELLGMVRDQLHDTLLALPKDEGGAGTTATERVIPFLTLFIQVEDLARNKYDYNMSEKERGFALWLLEGSLRGLDSKYAIIDMESSEAPASPTSTISPNELAALGVEFRRMMPGLDNEEQEKRAVEQMLTYTLFHQMIFGRPDGLMARIIQPRKRSNELWKSDWAEVRRQLNSIMGSNPSDVYIRILDRIENYMTRGLPAARQRSAPQGDGIHNVPEYQTWVNEFRDAMNSINQRRGGDFGISPFTKAQEKMMKEGFRNQTVHIGGTDLHRALDRTRPALNSTFKNIEMRIHANIRETVPLVSNIIHRLTTQMDGDNISSVRNDAMELLVRVGDITSSNHSYQSLIASLEAVEQSIDHQIEYQNATRQVQNIRRLSDTAYASVRDRTEILVQMKERLARMIHVVRNQSTEFDIFKRLLEGVLVSETVGDDAMADWISDKYRPYQDSGVQVVNWNLRYSDGVSRISHAFGFYHTALEMLEEVATTYDLGSEEYRLHRSLRPNMEIIQDAVQRLIDFVSTLDSFVQAGFANNNQPQLPPQDTIDWYEEAMMQQDPQPPQAPNRQSWTPGAIGGLEIRSNLIRRTPRPAMNELVVRNAIAAFNA